MSLILIECPVCQTDCTVEYFQGEQLSQTKGDIDYKGEVGGYEGCRLSETNNLSLTGIKCNPISLSKFFADYKHLSEDIWEWSKNG